MPLVSGGYRVPHIFVELRGKRFRFQDSRILPDGFIVGIPRDLGKFWIDVLNTPLHIRNNNDTGTLLYSTRQLAKFLLGLLAFGDVLGVLDHLNYFTRRVKNRISMYLSIDLITVSIIVNVLQYHRLLCLFHYFQRTGMFLAVAGFVSSMSQCVAG